ncbi:uncharacterized protein LOC120893682 [Anopheles arabiensis]|uniref:Uncharacterized protein n=1 Tax=Anopheles arabiensis TaxID=7173 RepID=A0A182HXM1_ANOAR|nr:uncharacterized protein LOC120893682 [Anopheles arabiensis]
MSSPSEDKIASHKTCYDDKSPPLYPSTDRFHPLGYSTPQQQGRNSSAHARNYYSAQPKHMLPRTKGSDGRYRHGQDNVQNQDRSRYSGPDRCDNAEQRDTNFGSGKRLGFGHNWRGHNNRNQRYGGNRSQHNYRQNHHAKSESYSIREYYHPSMLENPWEFLLRKSTASSASTLKNDKSDRDDDNEDGSSNSNGGN